MDRVDAFGILRYSYVIFSKNSCSPQLSYTNIRAVSSKTIKRCSFTYFLKIERSILFPVKCVKSV